MEYRNLNSRHSVRMFWKTVTVVQLFPRFDFSGFDISFAVKSNNMVGSRGESEGM